MQSNDLTPAYTRYQTLLKAVVGLLVLSYLVNCLTPLRLHVDTIRYFGVKDCLEFGCPPDSVAAQDYLPYGYTALLILLSKLHILKSFTIVLINCIYLFAGLYFIRKILGYTIHPLFFLIFTLLNWTIIKFVMHPLSEMQYIFFSMASLYFFHRYLTDKKLLYLVPAFGLSLLAFITRTVGITLLAALVVSLLWQYREALLQLIKRNKLLVVIVALLMVGVVVFSKQLGLNHYTGVMSTQFQEGITRSKIYQWHLTEWTEITLNTSIARLSTVVPATAAETVFTITGVLFLLIFIYLAFIKKNKIPFFIKTYLAFYIVLMFNWPFYDPRFWVPILPLMIAVCTSYSFNRQKLLKWLVPVFCAGYSLVGIGAIGYMAYTSLNKEVMARTHANGDYRNEYETHFYGKPLSDTATRVDSSLVDLLNKYD